MTAKSTPTAKAIPKAGRKRKSGKANHSAMQSQESKAKAKAIKETTRPSVAGDLLNPEHPFHQQLLNWCKSPLTKRQARKFIQAHPHCEGYPLPINFGVAKTKTSDAA